jgi:hypothetical protein
VAYRDVQTHGPGANPTLLGSFLLGQALPRAICRRSRYAKDEEGEGDSVQAYDETGGSLLGDDPALSWQSAVVVTAGPDGGGLERPYLGFEPRQALVLQMIRPGIAEFQKLVL